MTKEQKWIWQSKDYPNFVFDKSKLTPLLLDINYHYGVLSGIFEVVNSAELNSFGIEFLVNEAIDTSAIEGEVLTRDSVRSSIAKKLGIGEMTSDKSTSQSDGLIIVLLDAQKNHNEPFEQERLFGWHKALFPSGGNKYFKIIVGDFRGDEQMQIVSGPIGKEKVHYIAPPRQMLDVMMRDFLTWLNCDTSSNIIKAAIAHLWFVIIHPLDDGNGRIARALSQMLLTREFGGIAGLISMSSQIRNDKKRYYEILQSTTTTTVMDISSWMEWFLQTLLASFKSAKQSIDIVIQKTKFWDTHKTTPLNDKQIKVLNKMLFFAEDGFEGGMNTRKYASITTTSKATASRELKDLLDKGCIEQIENTKGRNISYKIKLGEMKNG